MDRSLAGEHPLAAQTQTGPGTAASVTRLAIDATAGPAGVEADAGSPWPTALVMELPEFCRPTALAGAPPGVARIAADRTVGNYRLLEPLGAGSQAVVWRAVQDRPGGREVALKLLAVGRRADGRPLARLRREANRCARLDHPSILSVYEFGEADGVAFLAMEVVDGWSLGEIIAQRQHPGARGRDGCHPLAGLPGSEYFRAIAGVLAQVAYALHAAHAGRVAHRDVKPANILLGRRRGARPFLADFGVGRDLDVATAEQLRRDWSGTPMYMAPERLRGDPADAVLCDVYALGVTLFEAATLSRPLRSPSPLPTLAQMLYLAREEPRLPRAVCPGLPPALEAIILGAMARDPGRRTATAAAVGADLDGFLAAEPVAPGRGWRGRRPVEAVA